MPDDNPITDAKTTIEVVASIIQAAGNDPQVKVASSNLGQTAVTLTKAINNVLLPIAALNFAFDKARRYFDDKFKDDLMSKVSAIPEESIVDPKPSIAGPALQGLAFSYDEPSLKEMYLNLLATSMDGRVAQAAHPAFVEIIKQLTAEEAELVQGAVTSISGVTIVQINLTLNENKGYTVLLNHVLNLKDSDTKELSQNPHLPMMVDNWIRLGLINVDYGKWHNTPTAYDWVETRPEMIQLRKSCDNDFQKVTFKKGLMERTNLGAQFARAVGIRVT